MSSVNVICSYFLYAILDELSHSEFAYENEKFFLGGEQPLIIKNIIAPHTEQNYGVYMEALNIFQQMFRGEMYRNTSPFRLKKKQRRRKKKNRYRQLATPPIERGIKKCVLKLIHHEMNRYTPDEYEKYENLPKYIESTLHCYCESVREIRLDWRSLLVHNENGPDKGYIFVSHALMTQNYNQQFISLDMFTTLLPNLEKITVDNLSLSRDTMDAISEYCRERQKKEKEEEEKRKKEEEKKQKELEMESDQSGTGCDEKKQQDQDQNKDGNDNEDGGDNDNNNEQAPIVSTITAENDDKNEDNNQMEQPNPNHIEIVQVDDTKEEEPVDVVVTTLELKEEEPADNDNEDKKMRQLSSNPRDRDRDGDEKYDPDDEDEEEKESKGLTEIVIYRPTKEKGFEYEYDEDENEDKGEEKNSIDQAIKEFEADFKKYGWNMTKRAKFELVITKQNDEIQVDIGSE